MASLLREIKQKYTHFRSKLSQGELQLKLGATRIYYRGGGRIHYYLQRDEDIRSGVVQLRRWHIIGASAVLVFCLWWLLPYGTEGETVPNAALAESQPVGGTGTIKTDLRRSSSEVNSVDKIAEEDERLKDLLLGIEVSKKPGKKSKQAVSGDIKKTVPKIDYKVKPGDTLSKIAKQHNVTVESIVGNTKITDPNRLMVGQTLTIPARVGFYYQVKKNEKLAHILDRHKVTLEKFLDENPDVNPDLLNPGDQIFLPGAKPIIPVVSWLIPVASKVVTSGYGWRTWPQEAFHKGIDLKAAYTTVRAAKAGEVTYAGWLGGYGNVVVVSHEGGYKSLYAHLSRIHVKQGQNVARGQSLGISGNTGYSFGPHLHFEITKNGENINPARVLSGLIRRR